MDEKEKLFEALSQLQKLPNDGHHFWHVGNVSGGKILATIDIIANPGPGCSTGRAIADTIPEAITNVVSQYEASLQADAKRKKEQEIADAAYEANKAPAKN